MARKPVGNPPPPSGVALSVRVTPRGGRDAVVGLRKEDDVLLVRVSAPPVDGAANRACIALIADALRMNKSAVCLIGGDKSRDKRFVVDGITETELNVRLARPPRTDAPGDSGGESDLDE